MFFLFFFPFFFTFSFYFLSFLSFYLFLFFTRRHAQMQACQVSVGGNIGNLVCTLQEVLSGLRA